MGPGSEEWLASVDEPVLDPHREIIDPHHHLWPTGQGIPYDVDALVADTMGGHNVVATVFVQCGAAHRRGGPEELRPVGETEFVAAAAQDLARRFPDAPPIAGIVAHADLSGSDLDRVLDAHADASDGRLRGIRHALAHSIEPEAHMIPGRSRAGLAADDSFRVGVRRLGERGLAYDSWHFHYQNPEFAELARDCPETVFVLDHFGTPLGVGQWAGRHDEVFAEWATTIEEIARQPNVVAKLGGLAMPDNGFGWDTASRPPTSDQFAAAQARWYHHTIEAFGPERCMFESNFPVDRLSLSSRVLWNGLQKIAASYTDAEQDQMFSGTARRVYRLEV